MVDFSSEFTNLYYNVWQRPDESETDHHQRLIASLDMVRKGFEERGVELKRNMAGIIANLVVLEDGTVIQNPPSEGSPFYTEAHANRKPRVVSGAFLTSMVAAAASELAQYEPTALSPDNTIL